jgi:IclR family acetate operon transcriptional repressor
MIVTVSRKRWLGEALVKGATEIGGAVPASAGDGVADAVTSPARSKGNPTAKRKQSADVMQPVVRSLTVLSAVGQQRTGITLQELSQQLSLPVASVYRLLLVLEAERFVARSATSKRYFVGPAALKLSDTRSPAMGYLSSPHPKMRELAHQTRETVFAVELRGGAAVCVALVPSEHPLRLYVQMGQEMPLNAAASARVLLADMDEPTAAEMLSRSPMIAYSSRTPTRPAEVLEHLETVRHRGYDICDDELDRDVWAVSVPIRQADGRVGTSLTLAAPRSRVHAAHEDAVIENVLAAGAAIAADFGWESGSSD